MTATDIQSADTPAEPLPRRRRSLRSRVSSGHVLTVVAALLAAIANVAVLRGGAAEVVVMVAAREIPAGATVAADDLRQMSLEGGALDQLLTREDLAALDGMVAAVTIPAGAPLRRSDLTEPAASGVHGRRISIPVDRQRAVGGDIDPEDRIDVIRVVDGRASYLVSGARVLAVSDETNVGIGSLGGFHVTIAVDADTALCLASAIDAGGLTVVLSTGQQPVATAPCQDDPPAEGAR